MSQKVPPDFKKLMMYLLGRYHYPVIRYNRNREHEVVSINISDCADIRLTISRGNELWDWEVKGELLNREVHFEADNRRELVIKLDERFREIRVLRAFLGIEDLVEEA